MRILAALVNPDGPVPERETVTLINASPDPIDLRGRHLADRAKRRLALPAGPLPAGPSLVLHYLEDWGPTLAEMRRVLRPGGRLIASVTHPFVDHLIQEPVRTADNERAPHGPRRSHVGQLIGALLRVHLRRSLTAAFKQSV
ncbi:class I SAM-dependent methyltransferase [Nonomuraea jabiensis]|uniref:class I SAM-dependent methyltransferase n=1 Tax=Nonomuraea jabiensis TaxID=882448 RepID=UPI003F4E396E